MANDMSDAIRDALGQAMRGAVKNAAQAASGKSPNPVKSKSGPLSGMKGLAAGAGLAAAAPLALKNIDKLRNGISTPNAGGLASKAGDQIGSKLKDGVSEKVEEAGGAGVGKGRRMPVQQSVDVAVPIETAYNQWTQFEDWPNFMHRVTRVTQDDDCTVSFATKIWGKTKEFTAKIDTQRPDERIKWRVSQGITHTGVVTFHELAPRLTRIELNVDVDPGSLIEKAARGMRHVKRAMRADLHRFKAFIEMQEMETGAWRGVIEDGELVEPHDESYDEERDYSDIEDAFEDQEDEERDEEEQDEDREVGSDGEEMPRRDRTGRFQREGQRSRSAASERRSSSRAASGSSGRTRSGGRSQSSSRSGNGSRSQGSSRSGGRSRSSSSSSRSGNGSRSQGSSRSGNGNGSSGSSRSSGRSRSSSSSSRSGNGSRSQGSSRSGNGSQSSRRKASSRS